MGSCDITSKSIGNKIYDKNKELLGEIKDIIITEKRDIYLDVEVNGCSPEERCLIPIEHIQGCGDYGYESDIARDSLTCRTKKK